MGGTTRVRDADPDAPLVSVVCPVFNEEDGIEEFHDRCTEAMRSIDPPVEFELVYVNDGSTDRSGAILRKLAERDERCRMVELSRNFGHQIAITSGIDMASGDAVVVIDADLQDPPEVVADMIAHWRDGHKVVYGLRTWRDGESRFKLFTAKWFYRLLNRLSDTPLVADSGDFRLMDRQVVDVLKDIREESRYIRGLVSWIGFSQCSVEYRRNPRYAGTSKFTLRRMLKFAADSITSFSDKPLRLSIRLGAVTTLFTLVLGSLIVLGKLLNPDSALPGYASLMTVVLFFGGVQLMSIGVLGEYVGRTYRETKRRPLYVVAERVNFDTADDGT